jgi:hypothetical protein
MNLAEILKRSGAYRTYIKDGRRIPMQRIRFKDMQKVTVDEIMFVYDHIDETYEILECKGGEILVEWVAAMAMAAGVDQISNDGMFVDMLLNGSPLTISSDDLERALVVDLEIAQMTAV